MIPPSAATAKPPASLRSTVGNALRGALIGLVELVPGVSGGTVALVLGIYDRLISSADHLIHGTVRFVRRGRRGAALHHVAAVEWALLIPLAAGMFLALFALSGPLHTFVEGQPVVASALFLGMVSASLLVPLTMAEQTGTWTPASRIRGLIIVLVPAAAAFLLLGLPTMEVVDPPWWILVISGAVAVCALALPGLSGSFILLTFGMYEPTLEAVSTRDFGYLGFFVIGALLGLVSIVRLLAYLLRAHRRATLLVATGIILGSLRALWPWQADSVLLPPADQSWEALFAFLGGAALVLLLWARERRSIRSNTGVSRAA